MMREMGPSDGSPRHRTHRAGSSRDFGGSNRASPRNPHRRCKVLDSPSASDYILVIARFLPFPTGHLSLNV